MEKDYYHKLAALEGHRWWNVARRHILSKVLERLKLEPTAEILEIGCGTGGNLKLLSQFGNVFAVEPDDAALQFASGFGIACIEKGNLPDDLPFENKPFDAIAVFDVLEHIDNEVAALKVLRSRLKQNGQVLLTVPAYEFMWSRIDIDSHHKRRYVKRRLIELFHQAGFTVTYATYFNTILFPLIWAIRIINKIRGKHDTLDLKIPPDFINVSLAKIFALEGLAIPRISLPFGVSVLVVAHPTDHPLL